MKANFEYQVLCFGLILRSIAGSNDFFPQVGDIVTPNVADENKINVDDDKKPCGEHFCKHGSKCFSIQLDDGTTEDVCDCTSAYTNTTFYSGEFCEYPSTSICSLKDAFGSTVNFCVNNGTCGITTHSPCTCPTGFGGPRCASKIDEAGGWGDYAQCSIECKNGGHCQKGMKDADLGKYERFADDVSHLINETKNHLNFEHCQCSGGFFGLKCEYKYEECGEGDNICFHGGACEEVDEEENMARCSCPSGYEGEHCEFEVQGRSGEGSGANNAYHFFAIFLSISLFTCMALLSPFYFRTRRRKNRQSPSTSFGKNDNIRGIAPENTII